MPNELKCPKCGKPVPEGSPLGICPQCLLNAATGPTMQTNPEAPTDGAGTKESVAHPTPDQLAPHFPQLEILDFIARGGMGAVYKARQPNLDRLVALKVLLLPTASDPGFTDRFKREARSLARLSHPNILAVYDFGQAGGFYFLMMEYVDGVNLRQIERAGAFTPREALQIIPQICEALQFAHDEGIVHRDIKPENILVDKKGRVKIADFGLAKLLGSQGATLNMTRSNHVMGTPHYMAPEQIERPLEVDHRADIYSLGVVFYEMLTGELPLGRFASPSQKVRIDVRLDEVVLRTLEKEPALRYQQASQVKTAVETIVAGKVPESSPPPSAVPEAAPVTSKDEKKRLEEVVLSLAGKAMLALVFLFLVCVIALFTHETNEPKAVPGTSNPSTSAMQNPVENSPPPSTPATPPAVAADAPVADSPSDALPPSNLVPNPPAEVALSNAGELHIVSGSGDFDSVSAANKTLNVLPGAKLSGKIKLQVNNLGPANAIAPLIFTPSWGEPSASWHTIQGSIPEGPTDQEAQISITAPVSPGVYHVIFAFQWQIDGDYVASATDCALGPSRWGEDHNLAFVSPQQIAEAQKNGSTTVNWLMHDNPPTYIPEAIPMDVLTIVVAEPEGK